MDCTLLGTGSAIGMPAPLCDCKYCCDINRTRPCLLVKTEKRNILFDISPDIREQSFREFTDIDSVFLTHYHHDHITGLQELCHTTLSPEHVVTDDEIESHKMYNWLGKEYDVYGSNYVQSQLRDNLSYIADKDEINLIELTEDKSIQIGSLDITPFIAEHTLGYMGYVIDDGSKKVVYHPDYGKLRTDNSFDDIDTLVTDGSSILGYDIHGSRDEFEELIGTIDAENIIFTNVSEHIAQESTENLKNKIKGINSKIVSDGYKF